MYNNLLSDLSSKDKKTYEELRQIILKDFGPKQARCEQVYRFLKARDFNLQKAEDMLRNHIKCREEFMETFKTFKMNKLQKRLCRYHVLTYTKEGEPLIYVHAGNMDCKGLFKSVKVSSGLTALAKQFLELEEIWESQSEKLGRPITKCVVVVNCQNFQLSNVLNKQTIDFFLQAFWNYERNFPERLHLGLAINAPSVFTIFYDMVKMVIAPSTNIKIYGKDGWKEDLLNFVNAEELPTFLGGNKITDELDSYFNTLLLHYPVPKYFYFRSPERRLRGKINVKEYVLKRGEKCDVVFEVKNIGSTIVWKFETESYDISFSLIYHEWEPSTQVEEIIRLKNVNAHTEMENGAFTCDKSGRYILTFDNSASWLREKHVFCKAYIKDLDGNKSFITS